MKTKSQKWLKKTAVAAFVVSALGGVSQASTLYQHSSTNSIGPKEITAQVPNSTLNLESGSLTFRMRNLTATPSGTSTSFGTLFAATNSQADNNYLWLYTRVDSQNRERFGFELKNGALPLISGDQTYVDLPRSLGAYRTVTYTFDKNNQQIKIYVDGQLQKTAQSSKFFNDIAQLNKVAVGKMIRPSGRENALVGDIFYSDITDRVLSEAEVAAMHTQLTEFQNAAFARRDLFGAMKTEKYEMYKPGQGGANSYRIPSLFTTKNGTVIAASDKRHQHAGDWGNIDTVIRRSTDGGVTWSDDHVILDLVSQTYGSANSAFLIDPLMVQDKTTGRIFMLVDMFPEMQGLFGFGSGAEPDGSGYKNIGGKQYRVLTDSARNQYTVRENGVVYDENHQATEYRVVVEGNRDIAYKDLGDLYRGETRVGNIFLNSQNSGNDSAPLVAKKTSYLWLMHSDDDGVTWSNPVDITPQVKADWMQFLGTGPGNGIQLQNGNLVLPVYYTNNVGKLQGSQSAAVIISADGGKTWTRGESPTDRWEEATGGTRLLNAYTKQTTESQLIQLDNGDVKLFSRNLLGNKVVVATSKDGGYTWTKDKVIDDVLLEPYSQLSVIKYSKRINGKEIVIFANPQNTNRSNGKVWLGEVQDDGSIAWKYSTNITVGTSYAYNSLTELPNGDIGLLYEEVQGQNIQYVRLNIQELVWHDNLVHRDSRNPTNKEVNLSETADQTYYKIGDGEMVQVGTGVNPSHLVVEEGLVTLNQKADAQGAKQAFASVTVNQAGTVRLGSADQLDMSNLTLNQGTLDLNGQYVLLNDTNKPATGLHATTVNGNIVNNNSTAESVLHIALGGDRRIVGQLGGTAGNVSLAYNPTNAGDSITLEGNSVLNMIDVLDGTITYAPNTTHSAQIAFLGNSKLVAKDGTVVNLNEVDLDLNSALVVDNNTAGVQLTANSRGEGGLVKTGTGALQLNGKFNHEGETLLQEGSVNLNGSINKGILLVGKRAALSGNGTINAETVWAKRAVIEPGAQQPVATGGRGFRSANSFEPQTLTFADVHSLGADLVLRINNVYQNMQRWEHDQVVINGNLTTTEPNRVEAKLLGTEKGVSDKNSNGQYDADEGLSLIQVKGNGELGQFVLDRTTASGQNVNDIYKFTLVSVDKNVNGNDYYDYRLQNLLIDENGESPESVIRYVAPTPPTADDEDDTAGNDSDNSTGNDSGNTAGNDSNNGTGNDSGNTSGTDSNNGTGNDSGNTAGNDSDNSTGNDSGNTAGNDSDSTSNDSSQTSDGSASDTNSGTASTTTAGNGSTDNSSTANGSANSSSTNSSSISNDSANNASTNSSANNASTNSGSINNSATNGSTAPHRAAVNARVPAYLVSNMAMFSHGNVIREQFMSNLWKEDRKGFYVSQQNGNSRYESNLGFTEYGYGFKAKQSSTLFGGYLPVSEHSELHLGAGFGKQTVNPKAADGWSEIRYKTTSFLAALHNQWDNTVLNLGVGYHLHKGKVSTADTRDVATIKGKHVHATGEVGYQIPMGSVTITPVWGLTYQHVKGTAQNRIGDWAVEMKPFSVFTQHVGTHITWQNELLRFNVGAFYEHNNSRNGEVLIQANQTDSFNAGRLGSALVFNAKGEIAFTKQLALALGVEHRKALDKAKINQTQISGKLEYRF